MTKTTITRDYKNENGQDVHEVETTEGLFYFGKKSDDSSDEAKPKKKLNKKKVAIAIGAAGAAAGTTIFGISKFKGKHKSGDQNQISGEDQLALEEHPTDDNEVPDSSNVEVGNF